MTISHLVLVDTALNETNIKSQAAAANHLVEQNALHYTGPGRPALSVPRDRPTLGRKRC